MVKDCVSLWEIPLIPVCLDMGGTRRRRADPGSVTCNGGGVSATATSCLTVHVVHCLLCAATTISDTRDKSSCNVFLIYFYPF